MHIFLKKYDLFQHQQFSPQINSAIELFDSPISFADNNEQFMTNFFYITSLKG